MTAERIPYLLCPACGAEMSSALGCSSCKTAAYASGGYTGKGDGRLVGERSFLGPCVISSGAFISAEQHRRLKEAADSMFGGAVVDGTEPPVAVIVFENTLTRDQMDALRRGYSMSADGVATFDLTEDGLSGNVATVTTSHPPPRPTR